MVELTPSVATLDVLLAYVTDLGAKATVTSDGLLGLRLPNWGLVVITGTGDLVQPFTAEPGRLLNPLIENNARLEALLVELANGGTGRVSVGDLIPQSENIETAGSGVVAPPSAQSAQSGLGSLLDVPELFGASSSAGLFNPHAGTGENVGTGIDALTPLNPETRRWGRDDLKRGEVGSQGQNVTTGVGGGLDHLVGLPDEEVGHRNGEKLTSSDNELFATISTDVGTSIGHLWLLGDTDYLHASRDLEDDPFDDGDGPRVVYEPLIVGTPAFYAIEDTELGDRLFPAGLNPLPITDARLEMDPAVGTIRLAPDGSLTFTPAPGYSGQATFTYTFTDPRTGEIVTGEAEITVEAVADPASISGAAQTLEDTRVATPITVTLNDPDGSEAIERVVITGLPAGATLAWDVNLPGRIVETGGVFTVTGSTEEIQALLASLTVDPPVDFHGQIVLGVAVTTIESNVAPDLPGYRDRETVEFDYVIDVIAVADNVTATGDDETTDEDVSVHLDDLAATFGDLLDGSETHTVEIRGVDAGAKFLDAANGTEYPFTIALDGTKTYTLTPADVPSVFFLPPPDESGIFDGMTIVAIAVEGSNGDTETASAPIRVVVAPVADPLEITAPTQATNEDTPVTFGDDIDIVVNDPLTQTVIEVVVSGFPAGTRIQYSDENGNPVDFIAPPAGATVTLGGAGSGFTEAEIRAALATLTLTPPADSDGDIALTVSATTEDSGGGGAPVTDTQVVPMAITVAAVADLPDASFTGGPNVVVTPGGPVVQGLEDTNLPVPVALDLTDLDGTETMDPVRITGLPAGYSFQGLTREPDGSYLVSGTKAAIQATLAGLVIVPPANADDDFTLQVTVTARESNPTTAGSDAGDVAVLTATRTLDIPVVFIAAHDAPVVTGSSSTPEDTVVNFGNNIAITRDDDTDGSESITRVVIANVPAGAIIGSPGDGTIPSVAGISIAVGVDGFGQPTYTLTRTTGSEADLLTAMRAMTLTPPADSDREILLSVAVTTTDNDGVVGTTNGSHTITLRAVADAPTITAGPVTGNEDQAINIAFSVARADTDPTQATGSEAIETVVIRNVPAGYTLSTTSVAATLTLNPDGTYTVTGPNLADPIANDAAVNDVLANLVLTPDGSRLHFDDDFSLAVDVTSIETNLAGGQVDTQRATATTTIPVTVLPIADAVTNTGASSVVEDTAVTFGADIVLAKADQNAALGAGPSSETITQIVLTGIPSDIAAVSLGTPTANVTATYVPGIGAGTGTITLALQPGGTEADIQAALDKLSLTPPADSDRDITLGLAVTTVDRFGTPEASAPATSNLTHTIAVTADAAGDEPTIAGAASGVEDTNFALPITITLGDTDGSEILDRVEITGLPTGATISFDPLDLPAGVTATPTATGWTFDQTVSSFATTQALISFLANDLLVRAPQDSAADFQLSVTAFNFEQNLSGAGGRTPATPSTTATIDVTVTPAFDAVSLPATSSLVNEDEDEAPSTSDGSAPNVTNIPGSVVFGAAIDAGIVRTGDTATFDAADRSEGINRIVLSGLPAGTVTWIDQAGVTVTEGPVGTFTLAVDAGNPPADPRALETVIRQVLATFTYAASDHGSADIPVGVQISRQDVDPDTGTAITGVALNATHTIVVNAVADAPIVTGDTETTSEDAPVHLDDLSAVLRDLDGSETLSVRITGVPAGASLTDGLGGPAFASPSAGVFTIPVASLGNVFFVPPAQAHGTYDMTIVATATEATVAGEPTGDDVASVQAPIQVTVGPVVDPVVANNSGSIVNENGTFNLGANILESETDGDTLSDFSLVDLDGSQSLSITISGFPAGITAFMNPAFTLPVGVTATFAAGTFTLSGANAADVMTSLAAVQSRVTEDGDRNFALTVTAVTDENSPVSEVGDLASQTTVITHDVTVRAVADTPTVNRGAATKPAVLEDSGFVAYPVTTSLNDFDGSETYQNITVAFSTPGTGARPVLQFTVGATTIDTSVNGSFVIGGASMVVANGLVTFSGIASTLNTALASLQARPGANNGENISITVTARAVESSPTEDNNGIVFGMGGGQVGPEIAVPTATRTQSFTIPVTPVGDTPTLTVPGGATGTEDTQISLGAFALTASPDTDGSEQRFIEVDTSSYPVGTRFISGGVDVGTVSGGFLRIPESAIATLAIEPPTHFSGTITLSVRGVVVDTNSVSGPVTTTTGVQNVAVTVRPDADAITPAVDSIGVEDRGPVAFGATLANTTTGIRIVDNGVDVAPTEDNNPETETISRIVLTVPADTANLTYTIAQGAGVGSASVAFDAGARTYTITSSLIAGDGSGVSQADRQQAEADIRATLAGFTVEMGPAHTDRNGTIAVAVTTLDVNGGVADSQVNTFTHDIVMQAVADAPAVTAIDPVAATPEDGPNVPLIATVSPSADDDGSETLTVRITVPQGADGLGPIGTLTGSLAGITLVHQGNGVYLLTATGATNAARAALFNEFMNGGANDLALDPRENWSGQLTGTNGIMIEAISTEAATLYGDIDPAGDNELAPNNSAGSGTLGDLDTRVEIRSDFIDVNISATIDPVTVKGNAIGFEDSMIPVPMSVTLGDKDGSETYQVLLTAVIPPATRIFGAGGTEILPTFDAGVGANVYVLDPDDVAALTILPPEHYSTALSGDILLQGVARVTDGATTADVPFTDIRVGVTGVADAPLARTVTVTADEDQEIAIGAAVVAGAGGNLNNVLVDDDTSESLSFVLSGVPAGVIPSTANPGGGVTYIGNGAWSVTAAAMETLTLPALPNFSGENPYGSVTLRAVSQEVDGDQAATDWDLTIQVNPVINDVTVDGFSSWSLGANLTEGQSEAGVNIPLLSAAAHAFVDNDGSEEVISYTFDLSGLIADAGLAGRIVDLEGPGAGLDELVANHITGTFTYDAGAGTITVLAADLPGVTLAHELFLDSNEDFSIPVSALVRDTAFFPSSGTTVSVDKTETANFAVDLIGTADTPTVFVNEPVDGVTGRPTVSGSSGTRLSIDLGGESTDTDVALGRAASEEVYYVIRVLNPGTAPLLGFTDGAGNIVALDNGDGTFLLSAATPAALQALLADLHVVTPGGSVGTANLRLTTIAVENDGDTAQNSTDFDVVVTSTPGGGGTPPLPPSVTVGVSSGIEDDQAGIALNVTALPAPGDPSNPSVAVMISNVPAGAQVIGALFNPDTGRWVASAAAVNGGAVRIIPPENFSGTMQITVEAVATNATLQKATTGAQTVGIDVTPVADGVAIIATPDAGTEDTLVALNIGLSPRDGLGARPGEDAGESIGTIPVVLDGDVGTQIGTYSYVRLSDGATLPGHAVVAAGDSDATIDGQSLVGFYRVEMTDVPNLMMLPANDWHGDVTVTVAAYSVEPANGDVQLETSNFTVSVAADADAPSATASNATGGEDTAIALVGLSAALNDAVTTNGAEVLSVKITGVPEGSLFSAGSNNGDGSWTIPVTSLATLTLTPPLHYSGTMTLALTAIALELTNGDEAQTVVPFTVTVTPEADPVEVLARNVTVQGSGEVALDLNVRMTDERGSEPGENPPEQVRLTFTGVPTGSSSRRRRVGP
ncbi:MAG: hypothetical protein GC150_15815 [Rhizobiales bacterium]|nr:hypothetical protein [Hyphomicrobiales bacterium]